MCPGWPPRRPLSTSWTTAISQATCARNAVKQTATRFGQPAMAAHDRPALDGGEVAAHAEDAIKDDDDPLDAFDQIVIAP